MIPVDATVASVLPGNTYAQEVYTSTFRAGHDSLDEGYRSLDRARRGSNGRGRELCDEVRDGADVEEGEDPSAIWRGGPRPTPSKENKNVRHNRV